MICTGCCNTLDHIVTYVFRQLTVKGKKARKVVEQQQGAQLIRLMEIRPELLQQMLSCILNFVMFEECRNQYSMSRPLLGLILLNEDYFGQCANLLFIVGQSTSRALWLSGSTTWWMESRGMWPPKTETGIQFPIVLFSVHIKNVKVHCSNIFQIHAKFITLLARCQRIVKGTCEQPIDCQQRYDD